MIMSALITSPKYGKSSPSCAPIANPIPTARNTIAKTSKGCK